MSQCIFAFKEINPVEVGKLYATPNFSIPCYENEFINTINTINLEDLLKEFRNKFQDGIIFHNL